MIISDLRLLEVDIFDKDDKKIYSGMTEDIPEEIKTKQIKILGNDGKKLLLKLI